jgi:hypothetical protein
MARGAFADDLDVMFSDFGEDVEIDGVVVCKGHHDIDTAIDLTGGQNPIRSKVIALRVQAALLPTKVKQGYCYLTLIAHDASRRQYEVESRAPIGDGAMEMLTLKEGVSC